MNKKAHEQLIEFYSVLKEIDSLYSKYAIQSGLSESAYWVMYTIRQIEGECTQKSICEQWSFSKQTINSSLKILEKQGLITLEASSHDKRSKQIILTQAGDTFAKEHIDIIFEMEENTFDKMSHVERTAMIESNRRYLELFRTEMNNFYNRHS